MSFRAFIAAEIEADERLKDMLIQLRRSGADLKVVRPELLHVTLKFLGDTDEALVDGISSRMDRAVDGVPPFSVRLLGMGAFPSLSNIRVVWVGIEDHGPLAEIARRLDLSLKDLGFERDQKGFKAHLTIARARSPARIGAVQAMLREKAAADFGTYRFDAIRLKKSTLCPQGPTYQTVREARLGGAPAVPPVSPS
jgi:2'-5' RNA ligase